MAAFNRPIEHSVLVTKVAAMVLVFLLGVFVVASTHVLAQAQPLPTSCSGLSVMLKAEIDRMRRLQERIRKEEKAPPADMLSAWQRAFGKKGDGVPSRKELKRVRNRADHLNVALQANGCKTIDIDQALTTAAQPVPVR